MNQAKVIDYKKIFRRTLFKIFVYTTEKPVRKEGCRKMPINWRNRSANVADNYDNQPNRGE